MRCAIMRGRRQDAVSDRTAARAPLGIGIVGCGTIARTHLKALLQFPDAMRVVALASRSPESITGAADYLRAQAEERAALADSAGNGGLAALYREHARVTPTAHATNEALVA